MKKLPLPQTTLALITALALALPVGQLVAAAPSADAKSRQLESALRARDNGDLATAKKHFEALLKDSPDNAEIKQQLADVNSKLAAAEEAKKTKEAAEKAEKDAKLAAAKAEKEAKAKAEKEAEEKNAAEKAEQSRVNGLASTARKDARVKATAHDYDAAAAVLDAAVKEIGTAPAAQPLVVSLQAEKTDLIAQKTEWLLTLGKFAEAKQQLTAYEKAAPGSTKIAALAADIHEAELNPPQPLATEVSAAYFDKAKKVALLVATGTSQYNAGDLEGAQKTFREITGMDSQNGAAQYFLQQIDRQMTVAATNARESMATAMLRAVTEAWAPPSVNVEKAVEKPIDITTPREINERLTRIKVKRFSVNEADMSTVVNTLILLAREGEVLDSHEYNKGKGPLNFTLRRPDQSDPKAKKDKPLTLTLDDVNMKIVLEQIAQLINYEYVPVGDIIALKPAEVLQGSVDMQTMIFPINRPTVVRMTTAGGGTSTSADPFADTTTAAAPSGDGAAIQAFLQNAGVTWSEGSSLVYDGAAIIVNQNPRSLQRIRDILSRYNEVKQVTIETKFLEVTEGNLREVGINWTAGRARDRVVTPNRSIAEAFAVGAGPGNVGVLIAAGSTTSNVVPFDTDGDGTITAGETTTIETPGAPTILPIINNAPTFPGVADFATGVVTNVGSFSHFIGNFDITATVRALERKRGTELLSSPSVTVLTGNAANIAVGQELRYPQGYSDARVTTGGGGNSGAGGTVGIASGTPQDFIMKKIGVELKVTPQVEEDNYSISLELSPTVTEFEGFVEYGGPNVAVASGSSLSAPSGFFQPVFSVREITTKVEVWDGATLVMGGLTREEVRKVNDKVPLLGDIPLIGRLFQSKGETVEKRNLLIFVTANLVSAGGSLSNQNTANVRSKSKFVNPSVLLPSGPESRIINGE
jgi:general secretion pathway protein D